MFDEDPRSEGSEDVGVDNARSPAPDAAPEDNPEPDALSGDVDIESGTESGESADDDQRSGVAGPAAGTTEGDDAVGIV
ncbi:MAG: hypothetical protein QOJ63_567 [Solirubrobacteraceae bacterium]|jgi:hypothetical protein|nr:hypothetical protein [Solirubrobacteraceae bacterium]